MIEPRRTEQVHPAAAHSNAQVGFAADRPEGNEYLKANLRVIVAALAVSVAVTGLKLGGYWITGSAAILSDALESIINVCAAGFATWSTVVSAKPPDEDHPYGHGKIEYFSAGFEGALIVLAAGGIFWQGILQILSPRPLPELGIGVAIISAATLINLIMSRVLIWTGNRTGSLVLVADGRHLLTDVYSSAGVIVGAALVYWTGLFFLDGAVACLLGVNIVVAGVRLLRESSFALMDASDPKLLEQICSVLAANRQETWIDVHKLRAWRAGARVHIDFHLIVPRELSVESGHAAVKELERVFSNHFKGGADVLIHLDPCTEPDCPVCEQDPCGLRNRPADRPRAWRRETLTLDAQ
jgi:cation diffusion facilitator family transporter